MWEDGRRNQFVLFNYLLTRINQNPTRLTLIPFKSTPSRNPRTLFSVGLTLTDPSLPTHPWYGPLWGTVIPYLKLELKMYVTHLGGERALKIVISPRDAALMCISEEKHLPTGVILILPHRSIHSSDGARRDSFAPLPSLWI